MNYDAIRKAATTENIDNSNRDSVGGAIKHQHQGTVSPDSMPSQVINPHHTLELSHLKRPFSRLVADELEKLRQEQRERDNLERLLREHELAIDRQTQERNKKLKRQLKEDRQRRARNETLVKMSNLMNKAGNDGGGPAVVGDAANSNNNAQSNRRTEFVNTLRKISTDGPTKDRNISQQDQESTASSKPAMVINLINSSINFKDDYTKRDFVFHIVTEEGGEYLLQAPDEAGNGILDRGYA